MPRRRPVAWVHDPGEVAEPDLRDPEDGVEDEEDGAEDDEEDVHARALLEPEEQADELEVQDQLDAYDAVSIVSRHT